MKLDQPQSASIGRFFKEFTGVKLPIMREPATHLSGFNLRSDRMADNRPFYEYMRDHPDQAASVRILPGEAERHLALQNAFLGKAYHREVTVSLIVLHFPELEWEVKGKEVSPKSSPVVLESFDFNKEIQGRLANFQERVENPEMAVELPDGRLLRGALVTVHPFPKESGRWKVPCAYANIAIQNLGDDFKDFSYVGELIHPKVDNPLGFKLETLVKFDGELIESRTSTYLPVFSKHRYSDRPQDFKRFRVSNSEPVFHFDRK